MLMSMCLSLYLNQGGNDNRMNSAGISDICSGMWWECGGDVEVVCGVIYNVV